MNSAEDSRQTPPQTPAIRVRDLSFAFHSDDPVLENVNFSLESGASMAILGPNGSGKTTLLKLIVGLLRPNQGSVEVFGQAPDKVRSRIGYVPQFSTMNAEFPASALEVVLMGAARPSFFYGTSWPKNSRAREQALNLLREVGLEADPGSLFADLSGGQRQKVLVARALMGRPDDFSERFMLILDEPTASADPQGKFNFFEFLRGLQKNLTLIVVSHDLALASSSFDAVALVDRGLTMLREEEVKGRALGLFFCRQDHCCPMNSARHSPENAIATRERRP